MDHSETRVQEWPEILRCLLIGNSVMTNLVEPAAQLTAIATELPRLREQLHRLPAGGQRALARQELTRQLAVLTAFGDQLNVVTNQLRDWIEEDSR